MMGQAYSSHIKNRNTLNGEVSHRKDEGGRLCARMHACMVGLEKHQKKKKNVFQAISVTVGHA